MSLNFPRPSQNKHMQSVIQETNLIKQFYENLPARPYCTDELGSLFVRVKDQAIKKRYIQQNTPFELRWLVYDVDRPTAHFDWYEKNAPAPNLTAMNPENGHAHLFYGLQIPVLKNWQGIKQHPLRYAGSIDVALTKLLEADPGYAGLVCKNPMHKYWEVKTWETVPYDLNWIADYLDLEPYSDGRCHLPAVGLGRNCTLFDTTRHWAYKQIRKAGLFNYEFFYYLVEQYARGRNLEFPTPLADSEVKAIIKSISKWTWKNMSPEGFHEWASRRGKKSGIVRVKKADLRNDDILLYKLTNPEKTNQEIAELFNVSLRTVESLRLSRLRAGCPD